MTAPAAARKGPVAGQMKPTDIMLACGSKSGQWWPESPDHWRWLKENSKGAERALAWIKLNSVGRASTYCVNAAGEALKVEHMAADLGLKLQTAKNLCSELSGQGRIRLQRGERLWYRADVSGSKPEDSKYSVQSIFPPYLIDFIENLPAAKKATVEQYKAWRNKFFADGMASLRRIDEQVQDNTLLAVGVNKKRLPKRKAHDPKCVQLSLLEPPAFVSYSVQGNTPNKVKNDFVQTVSAAPIIIGFNSSLANTNKSVGRSVVEDRQTDFPALAEEIKTALKSEWGNILPLDTPTPKLVRHITAALRGAPVSRLAERMRQRRTSAAGYGFAIALANDVGIAWAEHQAAIAVAAVARDEAQSAAILRLLDDARKTLADSDAAPYEIRDAEEVIALYGGAAAKAAGGAQ